MMPGNTSNETEASRILEHHASRGSALDSHPQLRLFMMCWLDTFLVKGLVDPQLRQLTILRVAWRCEQPFEWANHYRRARAEGLSDDDILSIRTDRPERDLEGPLRTVVRAADEVVDIGYLSPDTYAACGTVFTEPAILHEFLHLVAGYRMMATILNTTRPSVAEAGLPWWPPDGHGPSRGSATQTDV
jgi:alkylhydroperoxidase family enzyme